MFHLVLAHFRFAIFLLFVFCFSFGLSAQRSIYEDALKLAEISSFDGYSLRLEASQYYGQKVYITNIGNDEPLDTLTVTDNNCVFEQLGYFSFRTENLLPGDKLIFTLPDSTIIMPTNKAEDGEDFLLFFIGEEEKMKIQTWSEDTIFLDISQENRDWLLSEIYLEPVLNDYISNKSEPLTMEVLQSSYSGNPYLAEQFLKTSLFDSYYSYGRLYDAKYDGKGFKRNYFTKNPYQRIIEGDSLLNFRRNLAVTTTTSSYRNQIVTAQEQLRDANTELNENRRRGGAFSATNVAVGMSDFIAERAQEELNLTFFNRFKERLNEPSELTKLFPATRELMFKFEISNYKAFLAHARESFQLDLDNLGLNVPGILDLPEYDKLKNDPNVFNLSLIYSIADLAYRNEPVENILLAAHQHLQRRESYLNQSINLEIAKGIFSTGASWNFQDTLLAGYRQRLDGYLNKLSALEQSIERFNQDVQKLYEIELYKKEASKEGTNDDAYYMDEEESFLLREHRNLNQNTNEILSYPRLDWTEERGQRNFWHLDFVEKFLTAKLNGKDFHEYRINDARIEDYDNYYAIEPSFTADNVAEGIAASRDLLNRRYQPKFDQCISVATRELDSLIVFKQKQLQRDDLNAELVEGALKKLMAKRDTLANAYYNEIFFWEKATGLDRKDHYIGGLWLLVNALNGEYDGFYYNQLPNPYYDLHSTALIPDSVAADARALLAINNAVNQMEERLDFYYEKLDGHLGRLFYKLGYNFYEPDPGDKLPIGVDSTLLYQSTEEPFYVGDLWRAFENSAFYNYGEEVYLAELETDYTAYAEDSLRWSLEGRFETQSFDLENERRALLKELDSLERRFTPKLITARKSADDLKTILELSTHLMFAFRKYDRVYDTLYYRDTQRVEVITTIPEPDGTQKTYKTDSLRIINRPVPGTTDSLTAARWITRKEFNELRRDEFAWNSFLGLLYQRLSSVKGAENISPEGVALVATKFFELTNDMTQQRNEFRRKKAAKPKSISFRDYYPFIRSTVDLFNTVITTPMLIERQETKTYGNAKKDEDWKKEPAKTKTKAKISAEILETQTAIFSYRDRMSSLHLVPYISNQALSLYENIFVKDYGNAVLNATELMKIITGQLTTDPADIQVAVTGQLPQLKGPERKKRITTARGINAVFRYGSFMASMITAETSNQVKNILRATTLPPGSSRIKREVLSNFTVNSYLGAGLGRDRLLSAPDGLDADAFGAALSVPIGLTYSFSPKFLRNNSSFSVHVPLLDLGAITAYRSNSSGNTANIDNLPELEWKNLFSPGAYLIYNFANSPFSLGVGGQYGPQLREVVPENGDPIFLNSWRFPMAIFTIDVPFYNLHTGPRKIVVR